MEKLFLPTPTTDRWLTLAQAARLFGVHPVTLRLWTDRGLVDCVRTAGGHRRFAESAIRRKLAEQTQARDSAALEPLVAHGLGYTRRRLTDPHVSHDVNDRFDSAEREQRRADGRALLGLVMHYASRQDDSPGLLQEAHRIGARYASACLAAGMPLTEAVATAMVFRDALVESVVDTPPGISMTPAESARIVGCINQMLNSYQLGLIEHYLGGSVNAAAIYVPG